MPDNDAGTPQLKFLQLNREYNFTIDVAASPYNHKLNRYYCDPKYEHVYFGSNDWPVAFDGLAQDWTGERVFCNPPYSADQLHKWVAKAAEHKAEIAVLIIPPNTSTKWFHKYIYNSILKCWRPGVDVDFPRGRWNFDSSKGLEYNNNRADTMIVEFYALD